MTRCTVKSRSLGVETESNLTYYVALGFSW